ncbi:acetate/propionate family kinase [Chitinophaga qingshengii]|uniref:Acetate kinase n=1 Tax=Chitinophaga qingshengii TaxID=1569794 RepID=A0ABR7TF84_9BACT|nr:acetate/propionate family kinase [Chitinophaga qingshengii]MBC9928988.1 acetate/propionate family kinase [Chitinophaga qingshengii]
MLLMINCGSSSIKYSLYTADGRKKLVLSGEVRHIGTQNIIYSEYPAFGQLSMLAVPVMDYPDTIRYVISRLNEQGYLKQAKAVGHRVVHGMQYITPCLVTAELLSGLKQLISFDPDHLPQAIGMMEAISHLYPAIPQVACFDTAFHQTMPAVASRLPIPQRFESYGLRRYGFHGLSYQYLTKALAKTAGKKIANGRVVMAHLGNGASLAAIRKGKSIDTTMGFTPASGIPMSSRAGDIDPGTAWLMMKKEQLSPDKFNYIMNHEAGLSAISGTSGDMQSLLDKEATDERAAAAIALFCYEVKKRIGGYAAALGGIDALVFSGGIGEHSPLIRQRICEDLGFLGIRLHAQKNKINNTIISNTKNRVLVYVIKTDETRMMADIVHNMITSSFKIAYHG